jgi:hypothetical protein
MRFELIIDPSASSDLTRKTVSCMLWSTGDDPQLIDAQVFLSAADLREWLKVKAARYGENLSVRWTERLKAAPAVAKLVAACLDTKVPAD